MNIEYQAIDEKLLQTMSDLWGEWINKLIFLRDDTLALAAMEGNVPVGYVCVTSRALKYPLEHVKEAYIESLGVHENYRRRRIGLHLVDCAEKWAIEKGLHQIRTHSNIIAVEAINIWYKLNYGLHPHVYYQEEGCEGYYAAKILSTL